MPPRCHSARPSVGCGDRLAGGWDLDADEKVAATGPSIRPVYAGLPSVLDKSLVRQITPPGGEARLGILETIREFGLERLAASGQAEAAQRAHAAYLLTTSRSWR